MITLASSFHDYSNNNSLLIHSNGKLTIFLSIHLYHVPFIPWFAYEQNNSTKIAKKPQTALSNINKLTCFCHFLDHPPLIPRLSPFGCWCLYYHCQHLARVSSLSTFTWLLSFRQTQTTAAVCSKLDNQGSQPTPCSSVNWAQRPLVIANALRQPRADYFSAKQLPRK